MRARSTAKAQSAVEWKRNSWSIVLTDELSACVQADKERDLTSVSAVIRRILAQHYRDHPVDPTQEDRLRPRNGR